VSPVLTLAGRELPNALDDVRRYCGLPWSGGPPEVWAYRYFDALPERQLDGVVRPFDVLATAALHPGLSRDDLVFFVEREGELSSLLRQLPSDVDIVEVDNSLRAALMAISDVAREGRLSLLSKVFHFKRPRLVPMLDRAVVDWYRPLTGLRGESSWTALIDHLRSDLRLPTNTHGLLDIQEDLARHLEEPPSALRIADIALWMAHRTQ
jgi:hypothetical protein